MSAVLEQTKSPNLAAAHPKPGPKTTPEPEFAITWQFVQDHLDSIARETPLPAVIPGQTPSVPYEHTEKDGTKVKKMKPRMSCDLDEHGQVVPFSGPVLAPDSLKDIWKMVMPIIEHRAGFARRRMSECLLNPDAKGFIDDRAKLIDFPPGQLIFVEGRQ